MAKTNQWLVILTCLALLLPACLAASSFVYEDILAYPRYRIVLTEEKIPESHVFGDSHEVDKLTRGEVSTRHADTRPLQDQQPGKSIVMKSSLGQPFICTIPAIQQEIDNERRQTKYEKSKEELQQSIERGLKLLEPLSKSCLYYQTHGYWTYEYCHMRHVRQFHIDRQALQQQQSDRPVSPQQLGTGHSYYLGFFPGKDQSSNTDLTKVRGANSHAGESVVTSLRHVGDQRYLTQQWSGGTECDLTGKPRSIEIQFHCDMQAHDRISMFQEVATCQYQMIISTPRLCEETMLASQAQSDVNKIQCDPIVPDDRWIASPEETVEDEEHENNVEEEPEYDTAKDQIVMQSDDKEGLLATIAALTAQLKELERQSNEPIVKEINKDQGKGEILGDADADEEDVEVAFFTIDEDGVLTPGDNVPMKQLLESYMRLMTSGDKVTKSPEKKDKERKTKDHQDAGSQRRNKEAYEKMHFR